MKTTSDLKVNERRIPVEGDILTLRISLGRHRPGCEAKVISAKPSAGGAGVLVQFVNGTTARVTGQQAWISESATK